MLQPLAVLLLEVIFVGGPLMIFSGNPLRGPFLSFFFSFCRHVSLIGHRPCNWCLALLSDCVRTLLCNWSEMIVTFFIYGNISSIFKAFFLLFLTLADHVLFGPSLFPYHNHKLVLCFARKNLEKKTTKNKTQRNTEIRLGTLANCKGLIW